MFRTSDTVEYTEYTWLVVKNLLSSAGEDREDREDREDQPIRL
jgi:hypothetical protein